MAALLVALAVMGIMLSVAMPVWKTTAQREKEAELIFRGEQYAHALMLYQRQVANAAPPTLDFLVEQRFLRKKYKDPITNDDFAIVTATTTAGGASQPAATQQVQARLGDTAGGAIIGVTSKSTAESLRLYNGRNHYNEWVFMPAQRTQAPGAAGGPTGAVPGVGGQPAGNGQRGGARGQPVNPGTGRGPGGRGPGAGQPPGGPGRSGPLGIRPGGLPQGPSSPPQR